MYSEIGTGTCGKDSGMRLIFYYWIFKHENVVDSGETHRIMQRYKCEKKKQQENAVPACLF